MGDGSTKLACVVVLGALLACKTDDLEPQAANVAAGRDPPVAGCKPLGYLPGKGGGAPGGAYISNESLIEYALNDLRNQAAALGANYVHHDPPQLGSGDGTTTSVTMTGTAYKCDRPQVAAKNAAPAASQTRAPSAQSDDEPTAKPKAAPPEGAVGFTFGQTTEAASATCTGANHAWTPAGEGHFRCSATPTDMGLPADALLRFCESKLCAVMVTVKPAGEDGRVWNKALKQIRKALVQKYGKPDQSQSEVPSGCSGEKLLGCVRDGRVQLATEWEWPDGESIKLQLAKPAESSAPIGIRIIYRRPAQGAPNLEGL